VAAPLALAQIPNPEPGNLSIEGTVTDQLSGAPLAGARVVLPEMEPGRTLAYGDAAGHFRFDGLRAGPHSLMAFRTGYLQASQPVDVNPGQNPTRVRISLAPQAVIAGTVEDQDGFPVASASIIVLTRGAQGELVSASRGGITSDDHGRFRAAGLAPGSYYLHVEPGMARNWDARYTAVYYPAALKFEDAEAIAVASGQQRAGIVVRLVISGGVRVQGRVDLPPGFAVRQSGERAQVKLATVGIPGFGRTTYALLADDGSFTLANVQPGKYRLEPALPPPYDRGFTTGPAGVLEPNLEVGTADITGIVLNVEDTRPVDLPGTVVFEAGTQPAPVIVALMQRDSVQAQTVSQADGSFVLRGVRPGKYRLAATIVGGRARGVSARMGDAGVPYGNLELKGPNPGPLVIAMSSVFARVEGVIVDAAGQPLSGKFALFRATKPGLQPAAMGEADAGGRFSTSLGPGEYRVWTASAVPAGFWNGAADAPPGQGQLVTVVEGENPPLRLAMPAAR
jgi:protocatechuate 3,4-dioxygenase beta subunit